MSRVVQCSNKRKLVNVVSKRLQNYPMTVMRQLERFCWFFRSFRWFGKKKKFIKMM